MMTFLDLAASRVSVRGYRPDPVSDEDLDRILEAGRLAPTAANRQAFGIVVVRSDERRDAVAEAYTKPWFRQAPVVLAVCVERSAAASRSDGRNYADVDGAIVMDHLTLCAADLGLGTCWIGAFDPVAARRALELPEGIELLALTPLGYPSDEGRPKKRKSMDDLVHRETW